MKCPACASEMKPLFVGYYCPKDCDRKPAAKDAVDSWYTITFAGQVPGTVLTPFGGSMWRIRKGQPYGRRNSGRWQVKPLGEIGPVHCMGYDDGTYYECTGGVELLRELKEEDNA